MEVRGETSAPVVRPVLEGGRILDAGLDLEAAFRKFGVPEPTGNSWPQTHGEKKTQQAKRLKELEFENALLKSLVAEAEFDKEMLERIAKEDGQSPSQPSDATS